MILPSFPSSLFPFPLTPTCFAFRLLLWILGCACLPARPAWAVTPVTSQAPWELWDLGGGAGQAGAAGPGDSGWHIAKGHLMARPNLSFSGKEISSKGS